MCSEVMAGNTKADRTLGIGTQTSRTNGKNVQDLIRARNIKPRTLVKARQPNKSVPVLVISVTSTIGDKFRTSAVTNLGDSESSESEGSGLLSQWHQKRGASSSQTKKRTSHREKSSSEQIGLTANILASQAKRQQEKKCEATNLVGLQPCSQKPTETHDHA